MITLYMGDYCPYCHKVLKEMERLGLQKGKDYEMKDIENDENREELIRLGGKRQIPFLVDGDVKMYESDDIVRYLGERYG